MTTKSDIIRLKIQAALGSTKAMCLLAQNYFYGIGVDVNFEQAHMYLKKAVNKDFVPAKECIKYWFANNGRSVSLSQEFKDNHMYEITQRIYQDADKGIPEALHAKSLANLSNDKDFRFFRAIKEQKLACQQGYVPSLYSLGTIYYYYGNSKGTEKKGLSMIMQAAEKNFVPAIRFMMGISPEFAYKIIKRLLANPEVDGEVLYIYAQYYYGFGENVKNDKDANEYIRLLKMAAAKKYAEAAYKLGLIYESGLFNMPKDINEAISFYKLGMSLGDLGCMHKLFHSPEIAPHDREQAIKLFHQRVINELRRLYSERRMGF